MDDEIKDDEILNEEQDITEEVEAEAHSGYKPVDRFDAAAVHILAECIKTGFWTMLRT